jgi:HrpA-like RNA helicase
MRALNPQDNHRLTALGFHLAALPVDARIGKMIVFGAIMRCIGPVLTIAACLAHRSPFASSFDQRELADEAKRKLMVMQSDHLTLLQAFNEWKAMQV